MAKVLVIGKAQKVPDGYEGVQQVGSDLYDLTFGPGSPLHDYDYIIHQPTVRAARMPEHRRSWEELFAFYGLFPGAIRKDMFDEQLRHVGVYGDDSETQRRVDYMFMYRLLETVRAIPSGLKVVVQVPPQTHCVDLVYVSGWACRQLLCSPGTTERNTVTGADCLGSVLPLLHRAQDSEWCYLFSLERLARRDEALPVWDEQTSWAELAPESLEPSFYEIENAFLQNEVVIQPIVRNRRGDAKAVLFRSGLGWILVMPRICSLAQLLDAVFEDLRADEQPTPGVIFQFTGTRCPEIHSRRHPGTGLKNEGWEVKRSDDGSALRIAVRPAELLMCFATAARHSPYTLDVSDPIVNGQSLATVFFPESGEPYATAGKEKSVVEEALGISGVIQKCSRDSADKRYRLAPKYGVDCSRVTAGLTETERERYAELLGLFDTPSGS